MDKEKRTRKLRYSKSLLEKFNYEEIINDLYEIMEECENVRYTIEDEDVLVDALGGNEEEAYEFRMMFSELAGKAEQLHGLLDEYRSDENISDYFDDFTVGVSDGSGMKYYAYDMADEDYYKVTSFEGDICVQEAQKKLMRMKKDELIACSNRVFRIIIAYLNLKYKYDYLSATLEILNDEQRGIIDMVKELDRLYSVAEAEKFDRYTDSFKAYEKALEAVPERMWIE